MGHALQVPVELHPYAIALCDAACSSVELCPRVYWDLNTMCDAFNKSLQHDALDKSPAEPLMDALQLISNVTHTGMGAY
jgi:hypothetical protein